jgi:hypothetical protein
MHNLKILIDASKKVVDDAQDIINMPGIGFKGFIPATYGKSVGDIFKEKTGITLKQTSDKFRNTYNAPDEFEKIGIKKMKAAGYKKGEIISEQSANSYRVLRPIYIKDACLPCHGDPKGSTDVAGRIKEGYKVGDLRGMISVSIPTK